MSLDSINFFPTIFSTSTRHPWTGRHRQAPGRGVSGETDVDVLIAILFVGFSDRGLPRQQDWRDMKKKQLPFINFPFFILVKQK